jgi:Holliday junction DNA helicase RuvA
MIRQIRGKVVGVDPLGATIEVAGFGIFVCLAGSGGLALGQEATLLTYLAVKQDGMELYGFATEADRRFFELALLVPGVGPKTALALLRRAPRENLERAIAARDLSYLTRVAGLGKKAAEKLVVELAEKVGGGAGSQADDAEVFDTLVALGYTEREARAALGKVPENLSGKDARLKAALSAA